MTKGGDFFVEQGRLTVEQKAIRDQSCIKELLLELRKNVPNSSRVVHHPHKSGRTILLISNHLEQQGQNVSSSLTLSIAIEFQA